LELTGIRAAIAFDSKKGMEMTEVNHLAPTLEALRTADGVCLVVWCDHCKRWHHHGAVGPKFGDGNGSRVAHCATRREASPYAKYGYRLKEVGPLTRDNQYRISGRVRPRGLASVEYVYLVDR
jgi:hypothetical protein